MLRVLRQVRNALDRGRARADDGDPLVCQLVQIPGRIAAGVSIVPSAGVEGMALESVDTRNAGELRPIERPVGHDDEAGAEAVVAVGRDEPAALLFVPSDLFDLSLEADVAIKVEFFGDSP